MQNRVILSADFVGREKAQIQLEFSACGKWRIVSCALTKVEESP